MEPVIESDSELFLKYDYPETKDLCKQFLTLVVAVLVFSLTFSEEIATFARVTPILRTILASAWASMLVAIIACGIGLTTITLAAGNAAYRKGNFHGLALIAYTLIIFAGICFIAGLILLILTAVYSINSVNLVP